MDILESLSSCWAEFAQWAGISDPPPAAPAPAKDPVSTEPSPEDVARAERYRNEARRLEALAQSYEAEGRTDDADHARFKAQIGLKFAQDTLDFKKDLLSRENLDRSMGMALKGLEQYQAQKEEHWFIQSLKETLPYRLWVGNL